jgi:hypothetical protein
MLRSNSRDGAKADTSPEVNITGRKSLVKQGKHSGDGGGRQLVHG